MLFKMCEFKGTTQTGRLASKRLNDNKEFAAPKLVILYILTIRHHNFIVLARRERLGVWDRVNYEAACNDVGGWGLIEAAVLIISLL